MASGGIQYEEYLLYSKISKKDTADLSSKALEDAKKKIGDHGVFMKGSFDIPLKKNFLIVQLASIQFIILIKINRKRQ